MGHLFAFALRELCCGVCYPAGCAAVNPLACVLAHATADGSTSAAVEAAATALAAGGIPEVSIAFDEDIVGSFGAGFAWHGPADERLLAQQVTHDGDSEAGDFMQVMRAHQSYVPSLPCWLQGAELA